MNETLIKLTDQNQQALREISQMTGKSQQELILSAIEEFIKNHQQTKRLMLMQEAKGIWQDRNDLPSLEELRTELDR